MEAHVLLCSRDPFIVEAVEVSAAALGVVVRVATDDLGARQLWQGAAVRLLGVDCAARWGLPGPGEAYVVGSEDADLTRCSAELGLPVVSLPGGAGQLAAIMSEAVHDQPVKGRIVTLVGATGGLGVSTLTVSLALVAGEGSGHVVSVDLAEASGGIDILLGEEATDAVRWPDLAGARGELGGITDRLLQCRGAAFLSHDRTGRQPSAEAVRTVLSALARSASFTLVDAGRGPAPASSDLALLVVGADVRSVAAARMLPAETRPSGVIVRTGPGRSIPGEAVARALGTECIGVIGHDKAVPRLAEAGLPPVPGPARRYGREVAALWDWLRDA